MLMKHEYQLTSSKNNSFILSAFHYLGWERQKGKLKISKVEYKYIPCERTRRRTWNNPTNRAKIVHVFDAMCKLTYCDCNLLMQSTTNSRTKRTHVTSFNYLIGLETIINKVRYYPFLFKKHTI